MIKQVIHATNICGIDSLINNQKEYIDNNNYLCCSSIGCSDYLHRQILLLVEGNVTREYTGDIGSIGMDAKNTPYDELHLEGNFDIIGLYIPNNTEYFDLKNYAAAKHIIEDIFEIHIDIINATTEQLQEIENYYNKIMTMPENEYQELLESYKITV